MTEARINLSISANDAADLKSNGSDLDVRVWIYGFPQQGLSWWRKIFYVDSKSGTVTLARMKIKLPVQPGLHAIPLEDFSGRMDMVKSGEELFQIDVLGIRNGLTMYLGSSESRPLTDLKDVIPIELKRVP